MSSLTTKQLIKAGFRCAFLLFSSCCFPILLACRWGWGVGNKGESMFQRMPGWLQLLDGCCLMDGKRGSKPFILHWQSWNTETGFTGKGEKIPVTNSYSWPLPQHFLDIKMHVQASCLFLTNKSETAFPIIIFSCLGGFNGCEIHKQWNHRHAWCWQLSHVTGYALHLIDAEVAR